MADTSFETQYVKAPAYPRLKTRAAGAPKPIAAPAKPKAPRKMDPMLVARMLRTHSKATAAGMPGAAF